MKTNSANEPPHRISAFWSELPKSLFGFLEAVTGELTPTHERVALVLEVVRIEEFVRTRHLWWGRPPFSRKALARAFLAKAVLGTPTTKDFLALLALDVRLRQLCGFVDRVPSEATFSRAFADLAEAGLTNLVHSQLAQVHLGGQTVQHISRDATDIRVPARSQSKPKKVRGPKKKPGPPKGVPFKPREPSRQERQRKQTWQEAVAELPTVCDIGAKKNSKGHNQYWVGYKLHVDVADGGIPVSALTTSASLHDSQVAIPLMKMTAGRVGTAFYQLMDRGYVGHSIPEAARELGQVPIIKSKAYKGKDAVPFDPATHMRYHNRVAVERFFSDLKMNHGGNSIRVHGHGKVHQHLMFGALCIFALAILRI